MQYLADSFNMNEYRKPEMTLENAKQQLKNLLDIQLSDGNWNANEYMLGMANAMILAYAILNNTTPIYLDEPDYFLCDKPKETFKVTNSFIIENGCGVYMKNIAEEFGPKLEEMPCNDYDDVTETEWKDYGNDIHGGPCQCAICKTPKIDSFGSVTVTKKDDVTWVLIPSPTETGQTFTIINKSDEKINVAAGNDKSGTWWFR